MTLRLTQIAFERWAEVDGYAVSQNMPDIRELPIDRFFSFLWWYVTRNGDQQQIEKFRARIWQPPKGQVAQGPWSPEAEMKAFSSLKASLGK